MIRLGVPLRKDIRKVLFKIKNSEDYSTFLSLLRFRDSDSDHVEQRVKNRFKQCQANMAEIIETELINEKLIRGYLYSHTSRKNPGFYRKSAVSRVERYIRILKFNTLQILPEYYSFFEQKLDALLEEFRPAQII